MPPDFFALTIYLNAYLRLYTILCYRSRYTETPSHSILAAVASPTTVHYTTHVHNLTHTVQIARHTTHTHSRSVGKAKPCGPWIINGGFGNWIAVISVRQRCVNAVCEKPISSYQPGNITVQSGKFEWLKRSLGCVSVSLCVCDWHCRLACNNTQYVHNKQCASSIVSSRSRRSVYEYHTHVILLWWLCVQSFRHQISKTNLCFALATIWILHHNISNWLASLAALRCERHNLSTSIYIEWYVCSSFLSMSSLAAIVLTMVLFWMLQFVFWLVFACCGLCLCVYNKEIFAILKYEIVKLIDRAVVK